MPELQDFRRGKRRLRGRIRPVLRRDRSGLDPCQLARFSHALCQICPRCGHCKGEPIARLSRRVPQSAGPKMHLKDSAMISLRLPLPHRSALRTCGSAAPRSRPIAAVALADAAGRDRLRAAIVARPPRRRAARRPIRWSPASTAWTSARATSRWPRTTSAPSSSSCRPMHRREHLITYVADIILAAQAAEARNAPEHRRLQAARSPSCAASS